MSDLSVSIGGILRNFRKQRHMTLEELANRVGKQKSTLSKYEKGEIALDVDMLYLLADVLQIQPMQLLPPQAKTYSFQSEFSLPAFFRGINQLYAYFYDGRIGKVVPCVLDISLSQENQRYPTLMYMNCADFKNYQNCETTYSGYMEHFDAVTQFQLVNRDTAMERASIQILASYLHSPAKWGLWMGLSSRPIMPTAAKMLFTQEPLPIDSDLKHKLKVSKEDIRLLRLYNMMVVI